MANFESDDHALITGMIMGLAAKKGLTLEPVMNPAGYTHRFEVKDAELPATVRVFINVEAPVAKGVQSV